MIVFVSWFHPRAFLLMEQCGYAILSLVKQISVSVLAYGRHGLVSRPYYLDTGVILRVCSERPMKTLVNQA